MASEEIKNVYLFKLRKAGEPTEWALVDDDEKETEVAAWVRCGYDVVIVKLDDSDTSQVINQDT